MIKWKTKTGELIKITELENDHLINIIRMLERKAKNEFKYFLSMLRGKEIKPNFTEDTTWEDFLPEIYQKLIEEAVNRGIY